MGEPQSATPSCAVAAAPALPAPDANALIATLRSAGAQQIDPVRLHYLEVLARRAQAHQGSVRRLLDAKFMAALTVLNERLAQAQQAADATMAAIIRPPGLSLRALVRQLEAHAAGATDEQPQANVAANPALRPELKTIRNFRNTWSKLSAEKQVTQALEQAPKNAGPINSHMLVLRSLALMRDISPDYLNRFMAYADTLLCLDQGEKVMPVSTKKPRVSKAAKK